MNALFTYIVAAIVSLGVFYTAYIVFLRKEPLFRFNRIYLLSALLLSYLIPVITLVPDSFLFLKANTPGTGIMQSFTLSPVVITATTGKIPSLPEILGYIYLIGVLFFSVRLTIRLLSIYTIVKNGIRSDNNESSILWSKSDIPPFSFFRTMYLPVNLKDTFHLNEVIRHEQVHINSMHSFDIVFTQIMQIICWFNPFIPLIEKSLREIHEFEADKTVIHTGTDPVTYTKILFSQDKTALAIVLGNNFNYSLIKRRLTMFYKKSTRFARLKAIFVLPLTVCAVMFYTVACNQSPQQTGSGTYDTIMMGSQKVILLKNLAGDTTGLITIPILPPPPPPPTDNSISNEPIFTIVENMPRYPGGDQARNKYLMENIKYPESALKQGIHGTVYVSFVVEKEGSVNNVKLLRGIGGGCDEESIRVVKEMPKWDPGLQNGKPARVLFNMPIYFKLK